MGLTEYLLLVYHFARSQLYSTRKGPLHMVFAHQILSTNNEDGDKQHQQY